MIAVGTAVLVGLPAVLATLHAADARFRWWWPTSWMAIPSIIFAAGCLLVAIPVRRTPDPHVAGAASPPRPAVPSPGDNRAGAAVRPGQVVAGEIPREPASFVTRETVNRLAAAGEGRVAVVYAVTGLRGVGKTQIAAAYARARVSEGWALVGWVNAETRDALLNGLKRVADALGVADPEGDSEESARRLRAHLQTQAGEGLLVFDNATDPDGLRPFLPATGGTQIVITTTDRAFAFAGLGLPVDVSAFTRPQSVGYLRARTRLADRDGADTVAHQLGDLPLGLAQAAATIDRQHLTYPAYLQRLRQVPVRELLGRSPGEDYPHATAAALLLSVQATEASDPTGLTSWLLRVLAALSPDGIPRAFLDGLPQARPRRRLATLRRRRGRQRDWEVDAAIDLCVAGSLLDWSVTGDAVLMHRLLARVLRERDQTGGQWASTVTVALNLLEPLLFPQTEAWARREDGARLATQAEALWDADAEAGTSDPDLAFRQLQIRSWAVWQLCASADLSRAITTGTRTLADRQRVLGADHPDTLNSRNTLAYCYQSAGRPEQAIGLYEQTLADSERVLGADHPDTLNSRNNLAGAYQEAGRIEQAIGLHEQTLADRERVLGADHPDTLTSRNNLAYAHGEAGRLEQAIGLYEQTLADSERVLGADHPQTLRSGNNLATAYQEAGRIEQAIPLYEQTLADSERVLGADHPDTLTSRNNLADAHREAGRIEQAIGLHEQTLADRERVLGADHPDTLTSRDNLAGAHREAGRIEQAIPLHEQTLADSERVLGADHPQTLRSRNNLATAYREVGRLEQAIPLYQQTLADRQRVLGADHPDTLTSRNNLADAYQEAGRLEEAIPLYEQTLADSERVLGADHPQTLTSRNNLATAYREAGRLEEAIGLYEQTLADRQRVLGADHPQTLRSRTNLAYAYQEAGRLEEAIPLYEQTLADRQRVLGADHPQTLTSRNNLAYAYQEAGRLEEAIPLYEQTLADRQRVLGADHPQTLTSRNNLAYAYQEAGQPEQAIPLYEQTLANRQRVQGADHPDTLTSRDNLADAYEEAGLLEQAIRLHGQTLADRERVLGADHPDTLTSRDNLERIRAESHQSD